MATNDDTQSFGQLYEKALAKFKAIAAIAHLLSNDDDTDQVLVDAANHAWELAHDGAELMPTLWDKLHAEFERKPEATTDSPRDWNGRTVDEEEKALGARIFALPDYAVRNVMDFALNVVTAHRTAGEPNQLTLDEIDDMLKRGTSLQSINAFWHLKLNGVAVHSPAPSEPAEPDDLHEETVAEIREEHPDADEAEVKLRVAIRESITMTHEEEDATYERISKALRS
jgi:hypothetical protein